MQTDVYADILFAVNFSMDFLCFYITSRVMHRRIGAWRAVAAAAVGGAYSVLALFFGIGTLAAVLLDAAVCVLMNFIAFGGRKKLKNTLVCSAVYFGISALLGGIMTALYYLMNKGNFADGEQADGPGVWSFVFLAAAGSGLTVLFGKFFKHSASGGKCEIEIFLSGKSVRVGALCDSGNLLCDPVTGHPVIVIDRSVSDKLLSQGESAAILGMIENPERISDSFLGSRIRLIPASGASGDRLLPAFRPDRVTVKEGKKTRIDVVCLIAISDIQAKSGFGAIVPTSIL